MCVSHILSVTPWTAAHRLLCPWNSPCKNTGVGCHALLQRIWPTQGLNSGLLHCGQTLCPLSFPGSPSKAVRFTETESRKVLARGWRRGQMSYCLTRTELPFCKMREVMGIDGGNGYTWMYLMPLNSTLKNSSHGKFDVMCVSLKLLKLVYTTL